MNQQCRYCANLVTGNGIYCTHKEKEIKESTAKASNKCKDFDFCAIDAFGETDGYKPRKKKEGQQDADQYRQISIFDG